MDEKVKELQEALLKHQEIHRQAVEKHQAEIKTVKDAIKVLETKKPADSAQGAEEIKKINKAIMGLEESLTTIKAQRLADKRYNTEDGLAEHLQDSSALNKDIDFRRLAKSILRDPHAKKYKSAFMRMIHDPYDKRESRKHLNLLVDEIKDSDTDAEDSFIKKNLTKITGLIWNYRKSYLKPPPCAELPKSRRLPVAIMSLESGQQYQQPTGEALN